MYDFYYNNILSLYNIILFRNALNSANKGNEYHKIKNYQKVIS